MYPVITYLKPFKKQVILGPVFKIIEAIFELIMPLLMAKIIDYGVKSGDVGYVLKMGGLILGASIVCLGSTLVCQYFAAKASQGYGTLVRRELYSHINRLSYAELDRFGTASLSTRLINDVNQLQLAVAMLIRLVVRAPFLAIGAVIMAMLLDLKLSVVFLVATPLIVLTLAVITAKSVPYFKKMQGKLDRVSQITRESLSGARVIRAFSKQKDEQTRLDEASDDLTRTAVRVGRLSALLNPITSVILNAAIIAILWFGGMRVNAGSLSQGEIIAFVNYITQILLALIVVVNLAVIFTKAAASAARVNEVFLTEPSVRDDTKNTPVSGKNNAVQQDKSEAQAIKNTARPDNRKAMTDKSALMPDNPLRADAATPHSGTVPAADSTENGENPAAPVVEFQDVSFGYTGKNAIENISFAVGRGETLGIIGGTGSGKSTVVSLIPRLYEATEGAVLFHGVNVNDYPLADLRRRIGMVPQRAVLFTGTVRENIAFGLDGLSDEALEKAVSIAQAAEFVSAYPQKYDTPITQGGANLSGGQKQRLTIARALAREPEVLILDDASSALDFATDLALRRAIRKETADTAVIIISQRAASIRYADRILVLDDGRMAGLGTHGELMETCTVYQEICASQGLEAAQ